jgi:dihydrofolate synthase/folylpolyglutamate synthase
LINAADAELSAFERSSRALLSLIRGERPATKSVAGRRRRAEAKLARTRRLLAELGDPQRQFPAVHITGTSGKGSTAAFVAAILTAAGFRVGLRTSPYLQVPTEKLQIGSSLIDAQSFESLVCRVLDIGFRLFPGGGSSERLGYAEVWSAMAMTWFAERGVDVAVIEVGAGGRFDATNVVQPMVSVITSVGLDHVASLGPSIADIAWHKAGIIKPGAITVIGDMANEPRLIVEAEAAMVGSPVIKSKEFERSTSVVPATRGAFQRANARVALAVTKALADSGFPVSAEAKESGLATARLPGRLERMPRSECPDVWIDGAHNVDKVGAVVVEASRLASDKSLPVMVLGLLRSKDLDEIASRLAPAASAFVATRPNVVGKSSWAAEVIADTLRRHGFLGQTMVEACPRAALARAQSVAATEGSNVLATGSIYLAGELRRLWYPDEAIVLQRTPWPNLAPGSRSGAC